MVILRPMFVIDWYIQLRLYFMYICKHMQ